MTPSARARWGLPLVLAAAMAVTFAPRRSAHAQGAPQSQAEALFAEGRELLEKGRYLEACPKLAKSEELAPAVGTALNLAYCWEQAGKLRSAMDAYAQAETLAVAAGEPKRAAFARDRLAAVEPRTMKLIVRITPPEAPGLEVKRNGVAMARTDFDRPIAVDPEDYVVTATAPGCAAWRGVFFVKGEGGVVTILIPPLGERVATTAAPDGSWVGTRRIAALGLGALSALALGAGAGLALSARSRYEDTGAHCDDSGCDETGNTIQRGAVRQGNIATALLGLGLVSAGAGVYLWIVGTPDLERPRSPQAPPGRKAAASVRLEMRPLAVGIEGLF